MKTSNRRMDKYDPDLCAKLLKDIIGARTQKEFADEVGVNQSTISRILQKKNHSPSSYRVLSEIDQHKLPDCAITLDDLLAANGILGKVNQNKSTLQTKNRAAKAQMIGIIMDWLIHQKHTAELTQCSWMESKFRIRYDFAIRTSYVDSNDSIWGISIYNYPILDKKRIHHLFQAIFSSYYTNNNPFGLYSIIATDEKSFEYMKSLLKNETIPDQISIFDIDMKDYIIKDIFQVKLTEKQN